MSWITSGKLDAVLDIKFPRHPDEEVDLTAILNHLGKNVAEIAKEAGVIGDDKQTAQSSADARGSAEAAQNALVASRQAQAEADIIPGQHRLARPALRAPGTETTSTGSWDWTANMQKDLEEREVMIDIDLRFRDIKAAVPLYTTDLSVSNNAFIRPIVAFMKWVCKIRIARLFRETLNRFQLSQCQPDSYPDSLQCQGPALGLRWCLDRRLKLCTSRWEIADFSSHRYLTWLNSFSKVSLDYRLLLAPRDTDNRAVSRNRWSHIIDIAAGKSQHLGFTQLSFRTKATCPVVIPADPRCPHPPRFVCSGQQGAYPYRRRLGRSARS